MLTCSTAWSVVFNTILVCDRVRINYKRILIQGCRTEHLYTPTPSDCSRTTFNSDEHKSFFNFLIFSVDLWGKLWQLRVDFLQIFSIKRFFLTVPGRNRLGSFHLSYSYDGVWIAYLFTHPSPKHHCHHEEHCIAIETGAREVIDSILADNGCTSGTERCSHRSEIGLTEKRNISLLRGSREMEREKFFSCYFHRSLSTFVRYLNRSLRWTTNEEVSSSARIPAAR